MKEYIECITKHRAKHFVCGFCTEYCSDEPCEPSDCEWMQYIENEPAADVVPKAAFEQVVWERDVAIQQLREDYGVDLGEKKAADVVEVVRCKDCEYYENEECVNPYIWMSDGAHLWPDEDFYCAKGERRFEP